MMSLRLYRCGVRNTDKSRYEEFRTISWGYFLNLLNILTEARLRLMSLMTIATFQSCVFTKLILLSSIGQYGLSKKYN